jgi:hypothetical protein
LATEKHDDSFRVVDRRLFTAEGELRQEVVEMEQQEKARQEKAEAQKAQQAPAPPTPVANSTPAATGAAPAAEAPRPSRSFQMLIDLLARNAALFLGGYADPATGHAMVDLDSARELIDMMEALREKTRGNLAPEDDQLLTEVLNTLKLSYLEVSKAAAQAMREGSPAGARPNPRGKP